MPLIPLPVNPWGAGIADWKGRSGVPPQAGPVVSGWSGSGRGADRAVL